MAIEKIGKLTGARGGELMYAALSKPGNNKRGSGGRDNGRDGSKRRRQVRGANETIRFKRRRRGDRGRQISRVSSA